MSDDTTLRIRRKVLEDLRGLRLHPAESTDDIIERLIHVKGPTSEGDAFENAQDRYESYLEKCREKQSEIYREQLRKKNAENKATVDRIKTELGIDAVKGRTVPALGIPETRDSESLDSEK